MAPLYARKLSAIPSAEDEALCRESGCQSLATTDHYCRAHYIRNWARIREKRMILRDGKFRRFVEQLFRAYPEEVLQAVRRDLSTEEGFLRVCDDLGLHEGLGDLAAIDTDAVDEARVFPVIKPESGEGGKED